MTPITQNPANPKNWRTGRSGHVPDLLVIHGTAGTYNGTIAWFKNPAALASAHFVVGDEITQMVKVADTAYSIREDHAYLANEKTVNVEIVNRDAQGNVHVTDSYLGNAADLGYALCEQVFKKRPDRSFIKAHRELDPAKVECPADINVDFLVEEMQHRWDAAHPNMAGVDQPVTSTPPNAEVTSYVVPIQFRVQVTTAPGVTARLRARQDLAAEIRYRVPSGTILTAHGTVYGDEVDGNNRWYRVSWNGDDYLFISASISKEL